VSKESDAPHDVLKSRNLESGSIDQVSIHHFRIKGRSVGRFTSKSDPRFQKLIPLGMNSESLGGEEFIQELPHAQDYS
jgi:hypothetical protein